MFGCGRTRWLLRGAAALALVALAGCVYPAGYGYPGYPGYYVGGGPTVVIGGGYYGGYYRGWR